MIQQQDLERYQDEQVIKAFQCKPTIVTHDSGLRGASVSLLLQL